jgi:protein-tyrosine phosphatase
MADYQCMRGERACKSRCRTVAINSVTPFRVANIRGRLASLVVMSGLIDLHCHILPGIDDGPATMDDTLEMARAAVADGCRVVVATPHVSGTFPGNSATVIAALVDEVRRTVADAGIELDVRMGAEIEVTRAVSLDDADLRRLRLGGGPWLLVECPIEAYSGRVLAKALRAVAARGHRLVLAHPERSRGFQRDPETLADLVAEGMVTCITAGALSGRFGTTARVFAEALLRDGLAHVVASDAHDAVRRPPHLRSELESVGYGRESPLLARTAPAAILAGSVLPLIGDGRGER